MKLFQFLLLVGVVVASVEAQCRDVREDCARYVECANHLNCGCLNNWVRINCRKSCDACEGYEHLRPTGPIAIVYGGNHILTWDRLPFDCTARGEMVLYKNSRTGLRVHALFTRPDGVGTSVMTAVAIIDKTNAPRLQIAVDRSRSQTSPGVCAKNLVFWYGDERVSRQKVEKLGGYRGIRTMPKIFERFAYIMDVRSGARVALSLGQGSDYGCYFDRLHMILPEALRIGSSGLLGSPDNNLKNDWRKNDGTVLNFPQRRLGRHVAPANNYARSHWCVKRSTGSRMRYDCLGSFNENMGCNDAYDGPPSFRNATAEMRAVCGLSNYECLQDVVATGKALQGATTNILMREAYAIATPATGINAQPIGIRANSSWPVKISVSVEDGSIPHLTKFQLYTLNADTLSKQRRTDVFLTSSRRDADKNITLFSGEVELKLGNGNAIGYVAVPLTSMGDPGDSTSFALPNAVRGFSDESGRFLPSAGHNLLLLDTIANVELVARFLWPEVGSYAVGAKFENFVNGTACGLNRSNRFTQYAPRNIGKYAVLLKLKLAYTTMKFDSITKFSLYGHRSSAGSEPITLSVDVLRDGVVTDLLRTSVTPTTTRATGCPAQREESLLAHVHVRYTSDERWNIVLSKA